MFTPFWVPDVLLIFQTYSVVPHWKSLPISSTVPSTALALVLPTYYSDGQSISTPQIMATQWPGPSFVWASLQMLEPAPGAELCQCCQCLKLVPDQDPDSVTNRLSPRIHDSVKHEVLIINFVTIFWVCKWHSEKWGYACDKIISFAKIKRHQHIIKSFYWLVWGREYHIQNSGVYFCCGFLLTIICAHLNFYLLSSSHCSRNEFRVNQGCMGHDLRIAAFFCNIIAKEKINAFWNLMGFWVFIWLLLLNIKLFHCIRKWFYPACCKKTDAQINQPQNNDLCLSLMQKKNKNKN